MEYFKVSVVIPTHNRAGALERAVGSVLPRWPTGDEIIVVGDGSTDDTEAAVRAFGVSEPLTGGLVGGAASFCRGLRGLVPTGKA